MFPPSRQRVVCFTEGQRYEYFEHNQRELYEALTTIVYSIGEKIQVIFEKIKNFVKISYNFQKIGRNRAATVSLHKINKREALRSCCLSKANMEKRSRYDLLRLF